MSEYIDTINRQFGELTEQLNEYLQDKQFVKVKTLLADLNATDIGELLASVETEQLPKVFRLLPKEIAGDVFVEMDSDMQQLLIESLSDKELKAVVDDMFADETASIIEEMPANVVKRILTAANPANRAQINQLLSYPHESTGSIMTVDFVSLRAHMTVADAFDRIRKVGGDKKDIYTCYVTDEVKRLVGVVSVRELLLSDMSAVIGDIMEQNVISINTLADREEAARSITWYGFNAMPVVDRENRLVGIVTAGDAMEVIQEENTEDIAKMAAVTPSEKPYLRTSIWSIWLHRVPWLLLLMLSATFTGLILNSYESRLYDLGGALGGLLIACVPMLMDTGGNAGSQSSVTIIRGIALNEIEPRDIIRVLWKEFRAALLLALALGVVCFAKLLLIDNLIFGFDYTVHTAVVVAMAMMFTILIAKMVGGTLPLIAKKCNLDPAVVASPFITTIVDAISLLIYCNLALLLLGAG